MSSLRAWAAGRSRLLWLLLLGLGLAAATPVQPPGCNQTAHYSLVQSLAEGRPSLGRYHVQSCDISVTDGRFYAAKAPGLALASLPWFEGLRSVGAVPSNPQLSRGYPQAMLGIPPRAVWQLHLWAVVLPALALALLLYLAAERSQPGTGVAVAAIAALGTLLLPFASDYFAHLLSAMLGFAAFVILFLGRESSSDRRLLAAGVLAGLAVVTELTLGLVAVGLALYLLTRAPRLRRLAAYSAGVVLGLLPLGLFNLWAFGSPFTVSYENAVLRVGPRGQLVFGANQGGFFGVGMPHPHTLLTLLFSPRGLLVLSPVLALSAIGVVLLYRRGDRAEACLVGGLSAAFLLFNSGYDQYMGGYVPGPRFLIPAIPFAALALAPLLARLPLATLALGAVSIAAMVVATAAAPLLPNDDTHVWLTKWQQSNFTQSFLSLAGLGHGWLAISPFLIGIGLAAVALVVSLPRPALPSAVWPALAALAAWLLTLRVAPELLKVDQRMGERWGGLALVALVCAIAYLVVPVRLASAIGALPLGALAVPGVLGHTKVSLAIVLLTLAGLVGVERTRLKAVVRRRRLPS
ncbi:MAG: hypothetical protein ACXVZ1_10030 [Gaiellaceae bacterium]